MNDVLDEDEDLHYGEGPHNAQHVAAGAQESPGHHLKDKIAAYLSVYQHTWFVILFL